MVLIDENVEVSAQGLEKVGWKASTGMWNGRRHLYSK